MTKVYKHKTLGWIAKTYKGNELYPDSYQIVKVPKEDQAMISSAGGGVIEYFIIYKELIEDSQDREEVVEKSWINDARDMFRRRGPTGQDEKDFRDAIEKHAPKVKKFTRDDVTNRKHAQDKSELENMTLSDMICTFLRDHNILSGENINTTCQHESTGTCYTSNPPQYKCFKCGESFI